ncbi:phosphoserine phosphatase SerB [Parasphingorhabdus halotolerans]|uniref:Phosphoserine phosphatase n=1 Tax=Parasphingorhabdus halotolerans TaxID=2725558 RepID=A0A6H2DJ06_9SPHN|nr:phosphoserine phosphatase SerB [Parasphingorhabdus halotolerans]QJB68370.1 phosphoserine phosphatase SerB [Parasphingorhabdus halotolerans]
MLIATLIAAETLKKGELNSARDMLVAGGCVIAETGEIIDGRVVDIFFEGSMEDGRDALTSLDGVTDIAVQPAENREKKLLISDMDSTMITVECIDELADYAGIKAQIAEITERAMQGELDFEEALRGRVALLAGLEVSAIQRCLDDRVKIMPGAEILVKTMAQRGAKTILVSGGFTSFAEPVARQIGFERFEANVLGAAQEKLTGALNGPIVDASRKAEILQSAAGKHGLQLADCIAVGDGANDIPMIQAAGMGVAYHAKPKAAQAADVAIQHNDLTALLYIQGIASTDWAKTG